MNTNGKLNGKVKQFEVEQLDELRPHNQEAEESTIGSVLVDNEAGVSVPFLQPSDFYIERNGLIWAAIVDLRRRRLPSDIITLSDELERRGNLVEIGGPAYLTSLINATPTSMHIVYYAQIVKRTALLRQVIDAASAAVKLAYSDAAPVEEVTGTLKADLVEIEKHIATDDGNTMDINRAASFYLDVLDQRANSKDREKLQFPWADLNNLMPYLDAGTLVGVVAEPGAGKTVFIENCAEFWAKRGWKVVFYHLELSSQMMLDRRTQRMTGIQIRDLQSGRISGEQWDIAMAATRKTQEWPGQLYYVHCPGWSSAQIVAHAQKLHDASGVDVVLIDYFNKMAMVNRGSLNAALSREQDIEEIKIALERNGWVGVMAAQFDKSARQNSGFRTLADVKETSALEDKANVGVVIRRDRDNNGTRPNEGFISIVKCNAGQEGSAPVVFDGKRLLFVPGERTQLNG